MHLIGWAALDEAEYKLWNNNEIKFSNSMYLLIKEPLKITKFNIVLSERSNVISQALVVCLKNSCKIGKKGPLHQRQHFDNVYVLKNNN